MSAKKIKYSNLINFAYFSRFNKTYEKMLRSRFYMRNVEKWNNFRFFRLRLKKSFPSLLKIRADQDSDFVSFKILDSFIVVKSEYYVGKVIRYCSFYSIYYYIATDLKLFWLMKKVFNEREAIGMEETV